LRRARLEAYMVVVSAIASLLVLALVVPVIALFARANVDTLEKVLTVEPFSSDVRSAFIVTLEASAAAIAILLVLGVPLAYALARLNFPGKSIVEALVDLPLAMPHVVAGVMILAALGDRGLLGPLVRAVGFRVQDSFPGVVAVMVFVSAPLLVDTVKAGIASIDPMLEAVARSLGASPVRAFATVVLPLVKRHLLAGVLLAWARAISEVGALLVVAYRPKTINVLVLEYLNVYGLQYAIAVSIPLALLAIAVFAALRVVLKP